jgi:hypothetical protein
LDSLLRYVGRVRSVFGALQLVVGGGDTHVPRRVARLDVARVIVPADAAKREHDAVLLERRYEHGT